MALEVWDVLVGVLTLLGLLFLYGKWEDSFFSRRGVKSLPTSIPFVGHMGRLVTQKEHFKDLVSRVYKTYPGERYVGMRQFLRPFVVITDVELLKQITIKDFDHFVDHLATIDEDMDPFFGSNLFALKGQKWRDMRATLSPAFTSSKMRGMFEFVSKCGNQLANFYVEEMKKEPNKTRGLIEVEMKDAFTRYTNDVIASTAFGLEVDSLVERNNQFYEMGKRSTDFSGFQFIKFFIATSLPSLMKIFSIPFMEKDVADFFRNLVWDTVAHREKHNLVRPDMIQLLMQAKKGSLSHENTQQVQESEEVGFATVEESALGKQVVKRKWSDDDIVAQAVLFFIAGFDTASTLLCFIAHELALHPDIQTKLRNEIDEVSASNNGEVNYNDLHNMKYMDMVVSETLRLWPPAVVVDRRCVKPYTLPPPNDKSTTPYHLNVNEGIWVPIYGMHHDPRYFKNPEVFDPERFSDENKGNIVPFSYIPFGIGPRNCIGSRFALMETKAVLFHIIRNFELVQTAKTQHPIQLKTNTFNVHAKKGFWIGMKLRQS